MSIETRELRYVPARGLELRNRTGNEGGTLVGYAAVFDAWSEDLGGFREKIAPGAFKRALAERQDVRARFEHDSRFILGRTTAGTLRLSEDSTGLWMEIDLADTQAARDVAVSVARGDVTGASFAFQTVRDEWNYSGDMADRTLLDVNLFDVGPVVNPAYPDTAVAMRSLETVRAEQARIAAEIRDRDLNLISLRLLSL